MTFDTNIDESRIKCKSYFDKLFGARKQIEVKEIKKTRSNLQNRALHLFFRFVSDELNNMGLEFYYNGIKGIPITTRYTPDIVKEFTWKPLQNALFGTTSTKE